MCSLNSSSMFGITFFLGSDGIFFYLPGSLAGLPCAFNIFDLGIALHLIKFIQFCFSTRHTTDKFRIFCLPSLTNPLGHISIALKQCMIEFALIVLFRS